MVFVNASSHLPRFNPVAHGRMHMCSVYCNDDIECVLCESPCTTCLATCPPSYDSTFTLKTFQLYISTRLEDPFPLPDLSNLDLSNSTEHMKRHLTSLTRLSMF